MNIEEITQILKNSGVRLTPQRLAICQQVMASKEHPTSAMIYQQLKPDYPSLSLATVYNTLDILANLGIINEIGYAADRQVHYDGEKDPHLHIVCTSCGAIVDIRDDRLFQLNNQIIQRSGYQLIGSHLVYYGLCPSCQSKKKESFTR